MKNITPSVLDMLMWPTPYHMHQSFDRGYERRQPVERSADEIRLAIKKRKTRKSIKAKRKQNRNSK
jgi:hypothetical protein